ncbi:hypothetical protein [uncultured Adlercreutzia sp.]|uniref:hypothetical protein n=1 Tax=uncultured Adlercreutzia sp. TaxID=875803 RepID=UPI00272E7D61|nr:hypothetical protein [uncultured Adlercreutzia sp.]
MEQDDALEDHLAGYLIFRMTFGAFAQEGAENKTAPWGTVSQPQTKSEVEK